MSQPVRFQFNPIILTVSDSLITSALSRPSTSINWLKISSTIDQNLQNPNFQIDSIGSIDAVILHLAENIQSAILTNTFNKPNQNNHQNSLSSKILLEILLKTPTVKRQINSKITFIRNMFNTHKQDEWNKFIDSLDFFINSIRISSIKHQPTTRLTDQTVKYFQPPTRWKFSWTRSKSNSLQTPV